MRIFDLHTNKARYQLKVVLLHLWRVNVKTIGGFTNIPFADLFIDKAASLLRFCAELILIRKTSEPSATGSRRRVSARRSSPTSCGSFRFR
jgi:hypothetical protein